MYHSKLPPFVFNQPKEEHMMMHGMGKQGMMGPGTMGQGMMMGGGHDMMMGPMHQGMMMGGYPG
jgi:hypothetical protein